MGWNKKIHQELTPALLEALEYKLRADNRKIRGKANHYTLDKQTLKILNEEFEVAFIYRLYGNKVVLKYCIPLDFRQYKSIQQKIFTSDSFITIGHAALMASYYLFVEFRFSLADDLLFEDAFLYMENALEDVLENL